MFWTQGICARLQYVIPPPLPTSNIIPAPNFSVKHGLTLSFFFFFFSVNTPWYTFTPPVQAAEGTVVSADAIPVPIMGGIVSTCTTYEYVGTSGLRVDAIVAQNGITMDQFLEWNTAVDPTNPVVWAQYWVCVGA